MSFQVRNLRISRGGPYFQGRWLLVSGRVGFSIFLQQTIPTEHQTCQSRFMSLLMNGPIISSYQLLIISSTISNNTQLNTLILQISVQPDNHPPEMLHLQVFWKVDVQNQCLFI